MILSYNDYNLKIVRANVFHLIGFRNLIILKTVSVFKATCVPTTLWLNRLTF